MGIGKCISITCIFIRINTAPGTSVSTYNSFYLDNVFAGTCKWGIGVLAVSGILVNFKLGPLRARCIHFELDLFIEYNSETIKPKLSLIGCKHILSG